MAVLTSTVTRAGWVTLVGAVLENDRSTRQQIAVEPQLEGPVWVPRENGVVVPEWTDGVWCDQLEPGERQGLGFATPGMVGDPPVAVLTSERAREEPPVTLRAVLAGRVPE
ncbi:MAG: hypothetical protein U5K37_12425 [Natrialbaceae archaeon]|nr:hypothetical protein [Natrialbaceae archaeon]